jgi:hypothetical protein
VHDARGHLGLGEVLQLGLGLLQQVQQALLRQRAGAGSGSAGCARRGSSRGCRGCAARRATRAAPAPGSAARGPAPAARIRPAGSGRPPAGRRHRRGGLREAESRQRPEPAHPRTRCPLARAARTEGFLQCHRTGFWPLTAPLPEAAGEAQGIAGAQLPELPQISLDHGRRADEATQAGAVRPEDHRHVAGEVDRADRVGVVMDVGRVQPGLAAVGRAPIRVWADQTHAGAAGVVMHLPVGAKKVRCRRA